ncbi:MAG: response regulator transcription factor [Candidatus Limiplasma sp.]|nr:response regulator transcription factor [Candidatus Limiplasma sp.]
MAKILVVEDDATLRRVICDFLRQNGHQPIAARDGREALTVLDTEHVELMVSDIMMPEIDGYELTKSLRDAGYSIPILMITAREQYQDMERGFGVGTDDYMVKPINMGEMLLRVKALLRRAKIFSDHKIVMSETQVDYDAMTVTNGNVTLSLPQKEFYLLYKLLSYPDKIITRQQLMDEIWGYDSETDVHTIDVHIARLRDKLKPFRDFEIQTIRGLGYKAVKRDEN